MNARVPGMHAKAANRSTQMSRTLAHVFAGWRTGPSGPVIAALPRQGLLWLAHAIARSGATLPRRTGRYDPAMATNKATEVHRTVPADPPATRPAREIALQCRRYEDHRLTGHVP